LSPRVLYVDPLELDGNPAIDAIAYGLQHALREAGIELAVIFADFRKGAFGRRYREAIERGIDSGVDAIVIYSLSPDAFSEPVAAARAAGIPVFSFVRPAFPVDGAVVYPNFNHGTLMAEFLTRRLPDQAGVAVIGGPDTVDDSEEVAGLVFALRRSHCRLLNDPEEPEYRNLEDVSAGGRAPAERILSEFSDLAGLITYNDATMLGALPVLEETGRLGRVAVISRNGSPDAVAAVKVGNLGRADVAPAGGWRASRRDPGNEPGGPHDYPRKSCDLETVVGAGALGAAARGTLVRALYINVMEYGAHPGLDALAHGLDHRLANAGIELRTLTVDVRREGWPERQAEAVRRGIAAGFDAIVVYILDPTTPATAVAEARAGGVPVFSFERPRFPVAASLVYPNFNHGVYMGEHLAELLPPGADVAVIGGPEVIDDIELVMGIVHGVRQSGLTLLNDPFEERYRNRDDVTSGGRAAAERLLADFSLLQGLIPFNDETLIGTLAALREAGRGGEMKLVSRNGSPRAVEAVVSGESHGTWDIEITEIGAALGELVARVVACGETLEGELAIAAPGRMITKENADTYVPWHERVPHTPLREGLG
jgi:ABC-type sugar transport system substrate-binding protein